MSQKIRPAEVCDCCYVARSYDPAGEFSASLGLSTSNLGRVSEVSVSEIGVADIQVPSPINNRVVSNPSPPSHAAGLNLNGDSRASLPRLSAGSGKLAAGDSKGGRQSLQQEIMIPVTMRISGVLDQRRVSQAAGSNLNIDHRRISQCGPRDTPIVGHYAGANSNGNPGTAPVSAARLNGISSMSPPILMGQGLAGGFPPSMMQRTASQISRQNKTSVRSVFATWIVATFRNSTATITTHHKPPELIMGPV